MLDEECLRPGVVSDETFLNKLNQTCCGHPHYESRGCKKNRSDKTLPHNAFRLIHYAGSVTSLTSPPDPIPSPLCLRWFFLILRILSGRFHSSSDQINSFLKRQTSEICKLGSTIDHEFFHHLAEIYFSVCFFQKGFFSNFPELIHNKWMHFCQLDYICWSTIIVQCYPRMQTAN